MLFPFIISFFLQLNGFGAASGILKDQDNIFLISDDSDYLYHYKMNSQEMIKIPLREDAKEMRIKAEKLDLEAIAQTENFLFVFGSGSKKNRKSFIKINKQTSEVEIGSYGILFDKMVGLSGIPEKEINIEGAIIDKQKLLLFNRGNGKGGHNGIFVFNFSENVIGDLLSYKRINLPVVDGVQFGFSDATLVGKNIYFLATGEATDNAIDDGEIRGTFLGKMSLKKFNRVKIERISSDKKFEGLTPFNNTSESFLLCEDADNGGAESIIYKLSKKPAK